MNNRAYRVALNYLSDEDTAKQPGQVVSIPPYRGDLLEYIRDQLEEDGIITKKASFKEVGVGYTGKFVVHDHFASKHHWDLRLEFPVESLDDTLQTYAEKRKKDTPEPPAEGISSGGSVLRSWAIPKHKIPYKNEKVLAIEVEPHVFEYIYFEGKIPKGSYGAGKVDIFDKGTFEIIDVNFDKSYKIKFNGDKLNGLYNLVKMGNTKNFLWFKGK